MKNRDGLLYYYLKTHDRVSDFNFEIGMALKFPGSYPDTLVSLAKWREERGFWTKKQTLLALDLVRKIRLGSGDK